MVRQHIINGFVSQLLLRDERPCLMATTGFGTAVCEAAKPGSACVLLPAPEPFLYIVIIYEAFKKMEQKQIFLIIITFFPH